MNLLSVVERVGRHRPQPFLAPLIRGGRVTVRTIQENIPSDFRVAVMAGGWYVYNPTTDRAVPVDDMHSVREYLGVLEPFVVIALHRTGEKEWLVVPWNDADATQRGWPAGATPRLAHLVWQGVRPLDILVVRRLGNALLFDRVDDTHGTVSVVQALRRLPVTQTTIEVKGITPEMGRARAIVLAKIADSERPTEQDNDADLGTRISWELEFMGATLSSWHEAGENIMIQYSHDGREFRHVVSRSLQVQTAGLCLDGTDRMHNLSSIVATMNEAVRQQRFDLEGAMVS